MTPENRRIWLALAGGLCAWAFWVFHGRALVRRFVLAPKTVAEADRNERRFLAVLLPKITTKPQQYTMTDDDLDVLLAGFRKNGYVSISLRDVRDFYTKGRPLPKKAVLIAFDRDQPQSIRLADAALRRHRMRAVVFLNKTKEEGAPGFRHALSDHHLTQLQRSGAWEVGITAQQDPGGDFDGQAVLDDGRQHWTRNPSRFPVRLAEAKSGYNDGINKLSELHVLRLRGERKAGDNLRIVHAMWPRLEPFEDRFATRGLSLDWVADWGVVSSGNDRLALVPTPRQTSASVFLAGTEDWRDSVIEVDLAKTRKDFWIYARYHNGDRYVRLGLRDGHWVVQQKAGAGMQPQLLGKAKQLWSLPARVRMIVKDEWVIVHVNGRMQFGKGLRVNRAVDRGRFQLSVYDTKNKTALAVVTRVAAAPLRQRWLALDLAQAEWHHEFMERLREEAVFARAISPRWLEVRRGVVLSTGTDHEFVRALADFNRCLLAPMVDVGDLPESKKDRERLQRWLASTAVAMDVDGLNVRLSSASALASLDFIDGLGKKLRVTQRRLWVTSEGADHPGWLRTSTSPALGTALLEAYQYEPEHRTERSRLWN